MTCKNLSDCPSPDGLLIRGSEGSIPSWLAQVVVWSGGNRGGGGAHAVPRPTFRTSQTSPSRGVAQRCLGPETGQSGPWSALAREYEELVAGRRVLDRTRVNAAVRRGVLPGAGSWSAGTLRTASRWIRDPQHARGGDASQDPGWKEPA